ncbi:ABC transporter ATP-binding protein [Halorussus sp. MSC15.2]|uniref:ABC transporter ATP-binding protein n=1 Tax=Halorussus sp. MSC15.2 TaxID=2283638 RepID=UPI0013D71DF2|nr:ABC transporter ATP-binding protein [Halorussus sp. MSC15.2]NEU57583.1 ABC transporter ATP-binding protein [Halorussus sp. MSC15.2]
MAAVETRGLTKEFGEVTAVEDLTLSIEREEIFGLLGPNGAGKSTTLNLILGFLEPTEGTASVFGLDPWTDPQAVRKQLGIVPEGYGLYDRLTAREHIEFAAGIKGVDANPSDVLERVGLTSATERKVAGYSRGMRQRLALGISLVGSPNLLVLDEPSTGFDPHGVRELREIVRKERNRGATVVFSSHNLSEVETLCDRIGIINCGSLINLDTIEGLHERTSDTLLIEADPVPDGSKLERIENVTGVSDTESTLRIRYRGRDAKRRVLTELTKRDVVISDFTTKRASLEDLFVEATTTQYEMKG